MKRFLKRMVTSGAGKASLLTTILESISSYFGFTGLGAAIGWSISSLFDPTPQRGDGVRESETIRIDELERAKKEKSQKANRG